MNTAVQLVDPADGQLYSIHDQGAGRIDVHAAATTPALIGETYQDGRLARGSVNFGVVETFGGAVDVSRTLLVQDVSGSGGNWKLSWEPGKGKNRGGEGRDLPAAGFDLQIKPSTVKVSPYGSGSATISIGLDGAQLAEGDYEGRLVATNGSTTLRVPLYVRVSTSGKYGSNAPTLEDPGDVNTSGSYLLQWSAVEDAKRYRLQEATTFTNHFADDAEGDGAQWTSNGWSQSFQRAHSGSQSYFSGQGPEQNNTLTTAKAIALPAGSESTLSYWTWHDIEEGFDFGYVEVSSNGGSNWDVVDTVNGTSDGWVKRSVNLSRYAGQSVLVRFRYDSDILIDLALYEGWYVDDISVDSADWRTIAEKGGTQHQVSNQPTGTYWYRVAALFNDKGFGKELLGPWSNVVDISVQK
ncbi:MAG: immune inhibitor A [Chloroflexota bacterium]|nr:immune inhibitor A [Chloroflexota bacterium]